jgi:predicted ester cyclase
MPGHHQASHTNYPPISYRQAKDAYFLHDGQVHSVSLCSTSLFREALLAAMDTKRLSALPGALHDIKDVLSGPDDLFSRWFLLCHCGLRFTAKPMTLYASKDLAGLTVGSSH